ncbi:unannotated protein [freshwater metagenome]|uniref:Unannotated protein n=1 Tax=freshwater metagenome TaxID=449393 RepID=A0A6J6ZMX4_9ZZZZ
MTDKTTTSSQDAFRHHHAVNVFGARFATNQNHFFATVRCISCFIGGEVHLADSCAWRGSETFGNHFLGARLELRVKNLIEVLGSNASNGFCFADLPRILLAFGTDSSLGHVNSHTQCCGASALANASLQHPQLALVNGELGVTHVFVVSFKTHKDRHQFVVNLRELGLQSIKVFGIANTSNHVFALRVDQEVTVRNVFASCGVTGETNAGARVVVAVTEHHRLYVDGGT